MAATAITEARTTEERKALIRRFYEEVWNRGNLDYLDQVIPPDHIFRIPGFMPGPFGRKEFRQLVATYRTAFPDVHFTIDDQIAEGDRVVHRWTAQGTHLCELTGIPPTGKRMTVTGIGIGRFEGGRLVEGWDEWDAVGLLRQIGVIPS